MRKIRIAKLTLNVGAGKDQALLEKGVKLIKHITGEDPVKTKTNKRIQAWGLRPGLPIGCKLTMRDPEKISELLSRLLDAKEFSLSKKQFDDAGNVSFGIHEYIDIPKVEYNPDIGIIGFQICVTLQRPGYRIREKRLKRAKINHNHRVSQDDAINFMKENFKVKIIEEEEAGEE